MKIGFLFMATAMWAASHDQGCGAGLGSDNAKGPSDTAEDGGTGVDASPIDSSFGGVDGGALPTVDCGALGRHFFCEDFDTGALPFHFDSESVIYGTLGVDTSLSTSASQSLLASIDHVTTAERTTAQLDKTFGVSGTRFRLAFAEWLDPACAGPFDGVQTGVIALHSSAYFLAIGHGDTSDSVIETSFLGGAFVQVHTLSSQLPRGRWTHLVLDADVSRGTMSLSVDGAMRMEDEPFRYPLTGPQETSIGVGVLTDNITFKPSACKANFDDVVFDVQP